MSRTKTETTAVIRTVAVVDIGATSIRMAIAEIDDQGGTRTLERVTQPVSLGQDTFVDDAIRKETIEECVAVLSSYRKLLDEYGIVDATHIRVVATSAVREARNRIAFQDLCFYMEINGKAVSASAHRGDHEIWEESPWKAPAPN